MSAALRSVLVTNSLSPLQSFIGHNNCCIWYVVVVLLVSAAPRSIITRVLEVHVTHVYNDQIDSVFADPEIRIFGKKKMERVKRPIPGNPTTDATEGDYTHLDNFLWLSSMQKVVLFGGCSSRVLGSLLRKTAVSGAMSDSRAENLLLLLLL